MVGGHVSGVGSYYTSIDIPCLSLKGLFLRTYLRDIHSSLDTGEAAPLVSHFQLVLSHRLPIVLHSYTPDWLPTLRSHLVLWKTLLADG